MPTLCRFPTNSRICDILGTFTYRTTANASPPDMPNFMDLERRAPLSTGVIAGCSAAIVVIVMIIATCIWLYRRHRNVASSLVGDTTTPQPSFRRPTLTLIPFPRPQNPTPPETPDGYTAVFNRRRARSTDPAHPAPMIPLPPIPNRRSLVDFRSFNIRHSRDLPPLPSMPHSAPADIPEIPAFRKRALPTPPQSSVSIHFPIDSSVAALPSPTMPRINELDQRGNIATPPPPYLTQARRAG